MLFVHTLPVDQNLLLQFLISAAVLAVLLPRSSRHVKWLVAAGLAQVSEFSFVLSSRARRLGLISREVSSSSEKSEFVHTVISQISCALLQLITDKPTETSFNFYMGHQRSCLGVTWPHIQYVLAHGACIMYSYYVLTTCMHGLFCQA